MSYSIIKMQFVSQARFGVKNLEDTFKICHSDTLFSAIFIETLNLYGIEVAEKLKENFINRKYENIISNALFL
ncbi:MAG: hypothetical protein HFJ30_09295 [Clostridia bacterium]|jgi:CRISPR type III-A-associated RAMP protein Csm4|nr:hypothetical protein [Clostridia bacterium]